MQEVFLLIWDLPAILVVLALNLKLIRKKTVKVDYGSFISTSQKSESAVNDHFEDEESNNFIDTESVTDSSNCMSEIMTHDVLKYTAEY